MAGPIKIAIVADAGAATKSVGQFATDVDSSVNRASDSMERASRASRQVGQDGEDGFRRAADGADTADTRAMGFRDTMTGVQDTMSGTAAIARGDLFTGFLTLGMGIGDLASGLANFMIPLVGKAAAAMKALNLTFLTNPVFLVIAAIVALVAIFVVAYQKSETFRRIVDGAFRGVLNIARGVWNWLKSNWPMLLTILTGPIGIAVRWIVQNFDKVKSAVTRIPTTIRNAFRNAGSWLVNAGRNVVSGLWNGIVGMGGWLRSKMIGFVKSTIPGPVAKALGIASPSKVAVRLGQFFGRGLGIGLDSTQSTVRRAAGNLAAATIATPAGGSSTAAGGGSTAVLYYEPSGDPLIDALMKQLRLKVRKGGGNVQAVLGVN